MKDALKQYSELRNSLIAEKAAIEDRLIKINAALSESGAVPPAKSRKPGKIRRKRASNKLSLKAAVAQVTKDKPLAKEEILAAIKKIGYRFATKDPMNSLNTALYTGKQFKNVDGKFVSAK